MSARCEVGSAAVGAKLVVGQFGVASVTHGSGGAGLATSSIQSHGSSVKVTGPS